MSVDTEDAEQIGSAVGSELQPVITLLQDIKTLLFHLLDEVRVIRDLQWRNSSD